MKIIRFMSISIFFLCFKSQASSNSDTNFVYNVKFFPIEQIHSLNSDTIINNNSTKSELINSSRIRHTNNSDSIENLLIKPNSDSTQNKSNLVDEKNNYFSFTLGMPTLLNFGYYYKFGSFLTEFGVGSSYFLHEANLGLGYLIIPKTHNSVHYISTGAFRFYNTWKSPYEQTGPYLKYSLAKKPDDNSWVFDKISIMFGTLDNQGYFKFESTVLIGYVLIGILEAL